MPFRIQNTACFLCGCVAAIAAIILMGAASPAPHHQGQRYDVDFDAIQGMKTRLSIEITDHYEQKAYLYILPPTISSDPRETSVPAPPSLVATINLECAGEPTLESEFARIQFMHLSGTSGSSTLD